MLTNIQPTNAGAYSVVVGNLLGFVTSQAAILTIDTPSAVKAMRSITQAGDTFTVVLTMTPPSGFAAYYIEELLPEGFTPATINDGGSFDPVTRRVTWGPLTNGQPISLTYTLRPPPGFSGTVTITGYTYFFGSSAPTGGDSTLVVNPDVVRPVIAPMQVAGLFAVSVSGEIGRSYRVEATDTLNPPRWEPVATITLTRSPRVVPDPDALGKPMRFYRTVLE